MARAIIELSSHPRYRQRRSPPQAELQLGAPEAGMPSLMELARGKDLQLSVDCEPFTLQFKLAQRPELDGLRLELAFGFPQIIERYGTSRSTRVTPCAGEVALTASALERPEVLDLSASGVCVSAAHRPELRVGQWVNAVELTLPEGECVKVPARMVRVLHHWTERRSLVALCFEALSPADEQRLSAYVFRRHPAFASLLPRSG